MLTTLGIIFPDTDSDAFPTDPVWVMEQVRRGDFTSGEEWEEYWRNPYRVAPEARAPFLMAVPTEKDPFFKPMTEGRFDLVVTRVCTW